MEIKVAVRNHYRVLIDWLDLVDNLYGHNFLVWKKTNLTFQFLVPLETEMYVKKKLRKKHQMNQKFWEV